METLTYTVNSRTPAGGYQIMITSSGGMLRAVTVVVVFYGGCWACSTTKHLFPLELLCSCVLMSSGCKNRQQNDTDQHPVLPDFTYCKSFPEHIQKNWKTWQDILFYVGQTSFYRVQKVLYVLTCSLQELEMTGATESAISRVELIHQPDLHQSRGTLVSVDLRDRDETTPSIIVRPVWETLLLGVSTHHEWFRAWLQGLCSHL